MGVSPRGGASRGQAWAIYGYTMAYRYTNDTRFLIFAQKVTDIYLKRLHETSDDYYYIEALTRLKALQ
ncbi:MAG: hypothetical protein J6Y23_03040 [Prevotella sp.]|nr:hypothetical protein [Prevotella sp.]